MNINSLGNKFDLLAEGIKRKVGVLMISETKTDEIFSSRQFYIEGFTHLTDLIETVYVVRVVYVTVFYICQRGYYIPSKLIEMNIQLKVLLLN